MTAYSLTNIPTRHILCFMFVTGFVFGFIVRVNINLTIVGMVKPLTTNSNSTFVKSDNDTAEENSMGKNNSLQLEDEIELGEFEWDEFQQGLILGSFFYGYMASQIPGGRIAEIYGIKPSFGIAVLMSGILSCSIPFIARTHWILLLIIRVLQGLAQGVMFPALSASVAKWVPVNERARFISLTGQGCSIGPVLALPLCGWILTTWGWPAVFYTTGLMSIVWYFFWLYLVYNSPDEHPRISAEEKKFLNQCLQENTKKETYPMPWKEVLTSFQFWLGAFAHVGSDWGFHTFYTYGPKYIKDALNFDISQSALLSSLPFLCQYISATLFGLLVDKLITNYTIPLRRIRKASVVVSHCMPALLIILLTFINDNVNLSVAIFTLAVSMLGALTTGHYQNPIDIAPNFAGSLTGIANTLGSLGGILCTTIAGASLQAYGSPKGWHVTFYVAATVYGLTSSPFFIWAKSEELPWNDPKPKNLEELKLDPSQENADSAESKLLCKNET